MTRKHDVDGDELVLLARSSSAAESEPTPVLSEILFVHEAEVERVFVEERADLVNLPGANTKSQVLGGASEEWVFAFRHAG